MKLLEHKITDSADDARQTDTGSFSVDVQGAEMVDVTIGRNSCPTSISDLLGKVEMFK